MRAAGCRQYEIGVESGSDRMLRYMRKGLTREQIIKGYDIAKRNGIRRMASFIVGFPTETEEDICMTKAFLKKVKPDFSSFFFLVPYPGTELYPQAIANGWIPRDHVFDESWTIRQALKPIMKTGLSSERLVKIRAELQNMTFFRNYIRSINIPFAIRMLMSILAQPRELACALRLFFKTGHMDYVVEGALRAYRKKIEGHL
jgi:anaerobic magnesium-protoporphyrin IX monomethyl ester cyclase